MRQPVASIRGNLVLSEGKAETRAVYRIEPWPGPGLVAALAAAVPADFSLLRIARQWSLERYVIGMEALTDIRHVHREALGAHLDGERRQLARRVTPGVPNLYVSVRLPRGASREEVTAAEEGMRQRLLLWLGCEPVDEPELEWLTRRAFYRGLPDPPERGSESEFSIEVDTRSVRIRSQHGHSHQAFLCLTLRPGESALSGSRAQRLLAPVEIVDFPVDVALTARRGAPAADATAPLLETTVSVAVSAPSGDGLEERIDQLRLKLRSARLHRPPGEQLSLFLSHLPGQGSSAPAYEQRLRPNELGAMLPQPAPPLGTDTGPYIGHTVGGAPRPVLFDPGQASSSGGSCVVAAGAPESGKTLCMQLLLYQAFLAGSLVCDVDAGAGHVVHELPGLRDHARVVDLSIESGFRGALDPLALAPEPLGERLACELLLGLLPAPVASAWQAAVREAVRAVAGRGGRCGAVIDELRRGEAAARAVAGELALRSRFGPAGLALGRPGAEPPEPVGAGAIVLRVPGIVPPRPPMAAETHSPHERLARSLVRLLALYGLRLAARDPRRHAALGLDEGWALLSDPLGREVARHLADVARARRVTPLLGARALDGAEQLHSAVSAWFCFEMPSDAQAAQALRALGLDDDDPGLRGLLQSLGQGACLMRDHAGRVGAIQVDVANPALVEALGLRAQPQWLA